MKAHLWSYAEEVTPNYHSGGGVLVVALDVEAARKAWAKHAAEFNEARGKYEDPISGDALAEEPDRVWTLADDAPEEWHVFADAGCC